ncbi:MAG: hypothetical protein A3F12_05925 [Gammaproteobacteria bacterium RIFCSPHIGHO2_12_FULL_38_14]|nr:MAG: hypothetical protein A3F12_05925 [Gammaproteobacteria bacterium RIFCSPHIGHO2_12_FULL_38_14]
MGYFSFRPPALIGIDCQANILRIVKLKKIRSSFLVEAIIKEELPREIFSEGQAIQWELLHQKLSQIVEDYQLSNQYAAIAMPSYLAKMHVLSFDHDANDEDILLEIHHYLADDLPHFTDEFCIDFIKYKVNQHKIRVFFVAVKREYITQYLEHLQACHLKIVMLDIDCLVLVRAFQQLMPIHSNTPHAVIYIKDQSVCLIVFNAEGLIFYQNFNLVHGIKIESQIKSIVENYLFADQAPKIDKFIVVCNRDYLAKIQDYSLNFITVKIEFRYLDSFHNMKFSCDFPSDDPFEYLLSTHLAMREVPAWSQLI